MHRLRTVSFLRQRQSKGQWFLIGAVLIISMILAVVLSKNMVQIGPDTEPWQKYLFNNIQTDNKKVLNAILFENATSNNIETRLKDYLSFLRAFGDGRAVNITSYFIVGLPAGDGLNVTVVNFARKKLRDVSITINGTTKNIPEIQDTNATTIFFNSVPDYFAVNYTLAEIDASGGSETETEVFETTKKVFSAIKLRIATKDENQIWQNVEWN